MKIRHDVSACTYAWPVLDTKLKYLAVKTMHLAL